MIMLRLATMPEPDPTPVSSIRTVPSAPSAPPVTSNPATSATLHSALPSASAPTGEVTRANKGKARAQIVAAPPVTVINVIAGPSTVPYGLRSKSSKPVAVVSLFDEIDDGHPKSTMEPPPLPLLLPPNVVVPSVWVQGASPPKTKLPFSEGDVGFYVHLDPFSHSPVYRLGVGPASMLRRNDARPELIAPAVLRRPACTATALRSHATTRDLSGHCPFSMP